MSRDAGRVLVVDDDVVLREVLTEYLAEAGGVPRSLSRLGTEPCAPVATRCRGVVLSIY